MWVMPKVFDQDAKDRAVRLVGDCIRVQGCSIVSACEQVARRLGVSASALRQWLQKSRRENCDRVCEIDLVAENARLCQEVRELRDMNELLKAASAFSRPFQATSARDDRVY